MKKILLVVFVISSYTGFSQDFEKGDKLFGITTHANINGNQTTIP
jgi:hypothetical protein